MSRYYGMNIEVSGFNLTKEDDIVEAANKEWSFGGDWFNSAKVSPEEPSLTAYGEDNLCGGESEEEFAQRVTKAVWKANGEFCTVTITATYLGELPCEIHELSEEDYQEMTEEATPCP